MPDVVLLYFSGHGLKINDYGVSKTYLATSECRSDRESHGMSMQDLGTLLQDSSVHNQVILLDCCHSGEIFNSSTIFSGSGKNRCIIAASHGEAFVSQDGCHGELTRILLEGFKSLSYSNSLIKDITLINYLDQYKSRLPQMSIMRPADKSIDLIRGQSHTSTISPNPSSPAEQIQRGSQSHKVYAFGIIFFIILLVLLGFINRSSNPVDPSSTSSNKLLACGESLDALLSILQEGKQALGETNQDSKTNKINDAKIKLTELTKIIYEKDRLKSSKNEETDIKNNCNSYEIKFGNVLSSIKEDNKIFVIARDKDKKFYYLWTYDVLDKYKKIDFKELNIAAKYFSVSKNTQKLAYDSPSKNKEEFFNVCVILLSSIETPDCSKGSYYKPDKIIFNEANDNLGFIDGNGNAYYMKINSKKQYDEPAKFNGFKKIGGEAFYLGFDGDNMIMVGKEAGNQNIIKTCSWDIKIRFESKGCINTPKAWATKKPRISEKFKTSNKSEISNILAYTEQDGKKPIFKILPKGKDILCDQGQEHEAPIKSMMFRPISEKDTNPGSIILATGGEDGTARLWEIDTETKICKVYSSVSPSGIVENVLFSPDGKYLATNSTKNTIYLWDVEKWLKDKIYKEPIAEFKGHQDKITSLVFSPQDPKSFKATASDRRLITSSSDGTIRMWDWSFRRPDEKAKLKDLMQWSCDWLQDYLRSNPDLTQDVCDREP